MSIEEQLKKLIQSRYGSVRQFCLTNDIKTSTLATIFARGISTASITTIINICEPLHISVDGLATGHIIPNNPPNEYINVEDVLHDAKVKLMGNNLLLDGKPVNEDVLKVIIDSIDTGIEFGKKLNFKAKCE